MQNKPFFSLSLVLISALWANAQTPSSGPVASEGKVYELFDLEKAPEFPGGEAELLKFLSTNIQYPELARKNNIQGSVALTFLVMEDGSVAEVTVVKDPGAGCGEEAARVVRLMPRWTPGEVNGKPVKVRYTLPVRFKLEGGDPNTIYSRTWMYPPPPSAVVEAAEFPGGEEAMKAFLKKNLRYPKKARAAQIDGVIKVECKIGPDGKLTPVKFVQSLGYGCNEEALRLIKKMPNWERKHSHSDTVIVKIPFRLN